MDDELETDEPIAPTDAPEELSSTAEPNIVTSGDDSEMPPDTSSMAQDTSVVSLTDTTTVASAAASPADESGDSQEVPTVALVSPAEIVQPSPSVAPTMRRGFTLPQIPAREHEGDLLDRALGREQSSWDDNPRDEAPPVRIGFPSDSISESRKEGVIPRILITVSLTHARDMFEQALEEAIKRAAPAFHKIAKYEVDQAAFRMKAEQRAADYRLRGPYLR